MMMINYFYYFLLLIIINKKEINKIIDLTSVPSTEAELPRWTATGNLWILKLVDLTCPLTCPSPRPSIQSNCKVLSQKNSKVSLATGEKECTGLRWAY